MTGSDDRPGGPDEGRPGLRLSDVLRRGTTEPPLDDVEWDEFHAALMRRAGPRLRRLRRRAPWWRHAARWARAAVPTAAAASLALGVLLARGPAAGAPRGGTAGGAADAGGRAVPSASRVEPDTDDGEVVPRELAGVFSAARSRDQLLWSALTEE